MRKESESQPVNERKSQLCSEWSFCSGCRAVCRLLQRAGRSAGDDGLRLFAPSEPGWILCLRAAAAFCCCSINGRGSTELSAMGNICGCVRGPKEECYVDPKKAPLRPGSKKLKGRRYFQRKKRKSVDLQPRCPDAEAGGGNVSEWSRRTAGESRAAPDELDEAKAHSVGLEIYNKGNHNGKVPAFLEDPPPVRFQFDWVPAGGSLDEKLRGTHAASGPARDGLLARKRLRRQLRRAVSFGAVEHMLRSLRGDAASGDEDTFTNIIWGSQARRRRRRRASVCCSGYLEYPPAPAECHSIHCKVKIKIHEQK